jgi:hypothetical protein
MNTFIIEKINDSRKKKHFKLLLFFLLSVFFSWIDFIDNRTHVQQMSTHYTSGGLCAVPKSLMLKPDLVM